MRGLVSIALILVGIAGFTLILGPVARVEATYRMRALADAINRENGDWRQLFIPQLQFILASPELSRDYALVIPKLYLQEPILPNVDPANKAEYSRALKKGIAHAKGTKVPGEGGLGYYFAHSSGTTGGPQQKAEFYLLNKLEKGDEVQIFFNRDLYRYRVTEKRVVWPNDLSFLQETSNREEIVLQTCWPIGTDLKRLLVFGEKV